MHRRVVVTGLGVAAPNGVGIPAFSEALQAGKSGIAFQPALADLKFSCQVGGIPPLTETIRQQYFSDLQRKSLNCSGIEYGVIAGMEAWHHAGLPIAGDEPDWHSGVVFGTGLLGVDKFREAIYNIDKGLTRRLGSTVVTQVMTSGISGYLGGIIGCGNRVTTNSSACTTGTEAILMAYERIIHGQAERMLAGSCSDHGPYIWGGFDAMRVMTYKHNDSPQQASRPMSATASGFVPGSGAGALVLESLESALHRGATIYGEVLGGHINSGGQRTGGSMTAPNAVAVTRCIAQAVQQAGVQPGEIDLIDGHLTATYKDPDEIAAWCKALQRKGNDFPYINALKGMTGHCLSASGSIECVAAMVELHEGFIYPSVNSEDLHPDIARHISSEKIPQQCIRQPLQVVAKASFGFGDVNACLIFKKYTA